MAWEGRVLACLFAALGCAGKSAPPATAADAPREKRACASPVTCHDACMNGDAGACRRAAADLDDLTVRAPLLERGCDLGDGKSCVLLGRLYDDEDTGVPHSNEFAVSLYERACRLGEGEGCELAGWCHQLGEGVPQDARAAEDLHRQASITYEASCERGDADDCARLGEMHRTGVAVAEDAARASALFTRACKAGSKAGCTAAAQYTVDNAADADATCDRKNPAACNLLGHRYEHGLGVPKDFERARRLYQTACDGGRTRDHGRGCDQVGFLVEHGLGIAQDYVAAKERYEQSCARGDDLGCYDLGRMYKDGLGVVQNDERAVELFMRTCNDSQIGCHSLAAMWELGRGVLQSVKKAADLYEKSCDVGEPQGCHGLASILEAGRGGIPADLQKAAVLYHKACEGRHAPACTRLGGMYEVGEPYAIDIDEGLRLYTRGCDLGDQEACTRERHLRERLTTGKPRGM